MKIRRDDLLSRYGIDLPVGKYKVEDGGNTYSVFSVRDDTEGCPLLGMVRTANGVRNCAQVNADLLELITSLEEQGDVAWIEIR